MGVRLLIDGLPSSFRDQDLCALFSPHGAVLSARMFTTTTAKLGGVGSVHMATLAEATRALQRLDGVKLGTDVLHILLVLDHRHAEDPVQAKPPVAIMSRSSGG